MKKTTREWVKKAEQDLAIARQARESKEPLHDGVCFHCQQCAEKYLKGLMEEVGLTIQKTHDLDDLFIAIQPHYPGLRALHRGLVYLSDFAVDIRYPGLSASKRQATAALRWAEQIRTSVRKLLHLRERPSRE